MSIKNLVFVQPIKRKYFTTIFLSAVLLLSLIVSFSWFSWKDAKARAMAQELNQGLQLSRVIQQKLIMAEQHVQGMRRSIEQAMLHQELSAQHNYQEFTKNNQQHQGAPWDGFPQVILNEIGALMIDPKRNLRDPALSWEIGAAMSIMPSTVVVHGQSNTFQWSYFYPKSEDYILLYPYLSLKDFLQSVGKKDVLSALNYVYNETDVHPLEMMDAKHNPLQSSKWTPPYLDQGGKGMMVALLAPVYYQHEFKGVVGSDLTLDMLQRTLAEKPTSLSRAFLVDNQGYILGDSEQQVERSLSKTNIQQLHPNFPLSALFASKSGSTLNDQHHVLISYAIDGVPWRLILQVSPEKMQATLIDSLKGFELLSLVLLISILILVYYQDRMITRPALRLAEYVEEISRTHNATIPDVGKFWHFWFERVAKLNQERNDYFSETEKNAQELEIKVEERTKELRLANQTLERALSELQTTQDRLIQTERLASLAYLVSGIAHEINTPLGNAVLAATTLNEEIEHFNRVTQQGLKRSELMQHISSNRHGLHLLVENLARTADLVNKFKLLAIHQSGEETKDFLLKEVLEESQIGSFEMMKERACRIEILMDEHLEMHGTPSCLVQVFSQLIKNSLQHGFENKRGGLIRIRVLDVDAENNTLRMVFSDNGCGMSADVALHVFDPFYTTKLGQGENGLGMHIVYNIICNLLHGKIEVNSRVGQGTEYLLSLPIRMMEHESKNEL
jgi:signal transduction histidine kinase